MFAHTNSQFDQFVHWSIALAVFVTLAGAVAGAAFGARQASSAGLSKRACAIGTAVGVVAAVLLGAWLLQRGLVVLIWLAPLLGAAGAFAAAWVSRPKSPN